MVPLSKVYSVNGVESPRTLAPQQLWQVVRPQHTSSGMTSARVLAGFLPTSSLWDP